MNRRGQGLLEVLLLLLFFVIAVFILLALLFSNQLAGWINLEEKPPILSPDTQRYFELKNASCATLSGNFLIVFNDTTEGVVQGLLNDSPYERTAAEAILSDYHFNQTTKLYSRGDWLKQVITDKDGTRMLIVKEGRIYDCTANCTMRLMSSEESSAYYAMLSGMRTSCAYFGNTKMPNSVDADRLLLIERLSTFEINGFRCEKFHIWGNVTYAQSLLNSSQRLNEDQRAVLWLISHLEGPVEECLDDGTGVVVLRNMTVDLTRSYMFDYVPGGYMRLVQKTELLYFTNKVPESFFGLPS